MTLAVRRIASPAVAPVHPNLGLEMDYRRRIERLITEMHGALAWGVVETYMDKPPAIMAEDARGPANELQWRISQLGKRWLSRFDEAAPKLARWFARSAADRSERGLQKILRDGGISVRFQPTRAATDVFNAVVHEQVALIKSIAAKHFSDIETMVMRSVAEGRDLSALTNDLQKTYGVSFRRAAFIARDQNNKATAVIQRVRQQELGITHAIWQHSHGGHEPRPEHVKWSGTTYEVAKGKWSEVDQAWVWPGTAINCRCVTVSVVPGYDA